MEKTLTNAQYEIISFLIKIGKVESCVFNTASLKVLGKRGFVCIDGNKVFVTNIGEQFFNNEVEQGRKLLKTENNGL